MADRHTLEELNNCSREELITIVLMMQGQLDTLNENIERLIEQVRIANSYRFGKHTETLDSIDGHSLMRQKAAAIWLSRNLLRRKYFHPDVTIRKKGSGKRI